MTSVWGGKVKARSLMARLANLGIVLLFPGFLVYHFALSSLSLPAFIQGLFGPVSAALLLSFVILWFVRINSGSVLVGLYPVFVIYVLLYLLLWTVAYAGFSEGWASGVAVRQSLETIVFYSALFGVGVFVSIESEFVRRSYVYVFWVVVAVTIGYALLTGDSMFYVNKIFQSEQTATYQGYGRSMLVISILVLAWTQRVFMRIVYAFFALLALFILGSRSDLFGFAFFVLFLFAVMSLRRYSWAALCFVGSFLFAVVVLLLHEWILSNRAAQVLDLSSASSWVARMEFMRVALSQIADSFIIGEFGGHVAHFGSEGAYAHNIFSAWVNYGLLGFVMILGLTAHAFIFSVRDSYMSGLSQPISVVSMGINAVSLLLILVAKSVFWPVVALGWGVYVNSQRSSKRSIAIRTEIQE